VSAVLLVFAQVTIGAQAIPMLSHADRVPGGGKLTQLRVSQPIVFASAAPLGGRMRLHAMVDFEGATMPNGQLATGVFGEGFNDKRHPHTYAHELIASLVDPVPLPLVQWSLTVGKGFAPFGSDDPMNRPALVFPVNHHWSQILERAVAIAAVRRGAFTLEAGLFNGDEPEQPNQWPNWNRFGDSWSARALVHPSSWLELQGSYAQVKSPEHRPGAGLAHDKASVSARFERALAAGDAYLMAEWAHDSEEGFFTYSSALVEMQLTRRIHRGYLRFEHTDRPEETRLTVDPFRSVRPHFENSNLGTSRWKTVTGGYGVIPVSLPVRLEAIVEGSYLHVSKVGGGFFDPLTVWGRNDLWLASVALRMQLGARVHRMGRYGVSAGDAHHTSPTMHGH
jgi:hypothetical protein